ncbi:MAG TPA: DUF3883 domain-containing protein [Vicinamibacterales bacterium]|nr:DUF3883 domain-containing protein [Vicinamibacterales bacterium]
MSSAWTRDEVELIAADYFAMLQAELSGQPVNKAERNRRLQQQIRRSKGSIEFKHANISAVLLHLGDLPYIDGYKPRSNYQQLLEQVVLERLAIEPGFFDRLTTSPVVRPEQPAATDFSQVERLIELPPEPIGEAGVHIAERTAAAGTRVARKTDFVRLDAENRKLGRMGEEWTLEFEARRLTDVERRPELAKRLVWVSDAEGDGAGYDIRSFNRDGSRRLIEVKTTGLAKYHPFYVSPNEVTVSEREAPKYHLYRLFRFGTGPRLYMLQGALSSVCRLEPSQYSARVARPTL